MSQVDATEYIVVKADQVQATIRSGNGFKAFERSATVLAFGSLIWGGFFLYDLFGNMIRKIESTMSEISEVASPFLEVEAVVNPVVLTEEGIQAALKAWKPGGGFRSRVGYEAALRAVAKKVDEAGVGTLTNAQMSLMKKAEGRLVKSGALEELAHMHAVSPEVVEIHMVDRAADFVIRDKNYWVVVLGLTVIPALPVVAGIIREVKENG